MKRILFLSLLVIISSCKPEKNAEEILKSKFTFLTIPQIDSIENEFNQDQLIKILVLLHNNFSEDEIKEHLNLTDIQYDEKINQLFGNGLIKKKDNGKFVPACMIIDSEGQKELKKIAKPIGKMAAEIVIDRLPLVKEAYSEFFTNRKKAALNKSSFDDASLFILSNVMLNNWQLKNIQEKFIRANIPQRGDKNYFAALFQINNNLDNIFLNRIYKEKNQIIFTYTRDFKFKNNKALAGITSEQNYMLLNNDWNEKLFEEMASIITKDLIENLNKQKPLLVKYYLNSHYKEETSFKEWLMWTYQFIVTEATEYLIEKNVIKNTDTKIYLVQLDAKNRLSN
ncbi:hypothetical protein [Rosettibacter firmus]|uniref:hypothetical protein n=1 Tax=Rosettibacter firmus TaxID=3111522 RepID=UPI00336C1F78